MASSYFSSELWFYSIIWQDKACTEMIQVDLRNTVRRIRSDNGRFVNQTLREYFEHGGISLEHLLDALHSINAASPVKQPYELLQGIPLIYLSTMCLVHFVTKMTVRISGKLQPKGGYLVSFIGYAPTKKAFRIYNRRTRRIIETIHVDFDELTAMASEHSSSGPALHE
ncbi:hypothetical protein Tco_0559481 [Tanacetum coccineum]